MSDPANSTTTLRSRGVSVWIPLDQSEPITADGETFVWDMPDAQIAVKYAIDDDTVIYVHDPFNTKICKKICGDTRAGWYDCGTLDDILQSEQLSAGDRGPIKFWINLIDHYAQAASATIIEETRARSSRGEQGPYAYEVDSLKICSDGGDP